MTAQECNVTLEIDGAPLHLPARHASNEDGEEVMILPFDATYEVLERWKKNDPDRRDFGWTGDADNPEPETAFVAWIEKTSEGCKLRIEYLSPFFDGVQVHNAYAVDAFETIAGIRKEAP